MSCPKWSFWGPGVCLHYIPYSHSGTQHVPIKQARASLSKGAACFSVRVLLAVVASGSCESMGCKLRKYLPSKLQPRAGIMGLKVTN